MNGFVARGERIRKTSEVSVTNLPKNAVPVPPISQEPRQTTLKKKKSTVFQSARNVFSRSKMKGYAELDARPP